MTDAMACAWPAARLAEAIEALGERSGLSPRRPGSVAASRARRGKNELAAWVVHLCDGLGFEAARTDVPSSELAAFLRASAPSILRASPWGNGEPEPEFLVILGERRGRLRLLGPDLREARVPLGRVTEQLAHRLGATGGKLDALLERAGVSGGRLARARLRLAKRLRRESPLSDGFILRLASDASTRERLREAGVLRWLAGFVAAHATHYVLFLLSWWILGRAALGGYLDSAWLAAWAMVLFTMLPFRMAALWFHGNFAAAAGGLLKRYLLLGALRLEPDEVRHLGSGHHLSRVIESEAVESLALGAGVLSLAGAVELALAMGVLALGAGGWVHVLLLVMCCTLTASIVWRYLESRKRWTAERLEMSHGIVEKMVGHRTRLAQQDPSDWHEDEDAQLARYLSSSRAMDDLRATIAVMPRLWLVVGLLGLAPAFMGGLDGAVSVGALAVGLGGLLFAYRALDKLVSGLAFLAGAWISLGKVRELLEASRRPQLTGDPSLALSSLNGKGNNGHDPGRPETEALLDVSDVSFHYRGRANGTLRGVDLSIRTGEELLLLGPSGGGKSTLVSVLTGLRPPEAGLVLLRGLDRKSVGGYGWTRRVASAPQFHENCILTETFGFNLLMGRRWPPTAEDLAEAEAVCIELGLGPLLERMPAGMMQMVGETGWRLSHGEKSRVYAARALLQGGDITILDETFGALDPESLTRAVACARARSRTLLLVAHP